MTNIKIWDAVQPDNTAENHINQIKVNKVIRDHKGNVYDTFTEMCLAYNKGIEVVQYRLLNHWSLEDALETPQDNHNRPKKYECKDFNDKTFGSLSEMCLFYGISRTLYTYRLKCGWSQEKALTTPKSRKLGQGRHCTII